MREWRRGTAIGLGLCLTGILIFSSGRGFAQSDGQDQPPPKQQQDQPPPKDKPASDKHKGSHGDKDKRNDHRGGDHAVVGLGIDVSSLVRRVVHGKHTPPPFAFCGGNPGDSGAKSADLTGARLIGKEHNHQGDFPNQKALVNQCISVAFSNSLQWLKNTQGVDLKDDDITPGALDRIVKRDAAHDKPVDFDQAEARKSAAFRKVIDTSYLDPGDITRIPDAIDKNCDVELFANSPDGGGHAVAITGISQQNIPGKGRKWVIKIVEDAKQGPPDAPHDPVTESVIFPTGKDQISGGAGLDGKKLYKFVVECKKGTAF